MSYKPTSARPKSTSTPRFRVGLYKKLLHVDVSLFPRNPARLQILCIYLRRLDIPMDDIVLVDEVEGAEKGGKVVPHISNKERTVLKSKVRMREVR